MLATVFAATALLAPTEIFRVGGVNMEPKFREGQRVEFDLGAYKQRSPRAGEIVLFRPPRGADLNRCASEPAAGEMCAKPFGGADRTVRFISRIVAVGGDRISLRKGRLLRNGRLEAPRNLRHCGQGCDFPKTIKVPGGHVFVLGDNRGESDDSRFWGAVPVKQVLGRYLRVRNSLGVQP
jgi:signal peptidase I